MPLQYRGYLLLCNPTTLPSVSLAARSTHSHSLHTRSSVTLSEMSRQRAQQPELSGATVVFYLYLLVGEPLAATATQSNLKSLASPVYLYRSDLWGPALKMGELRQGETQRRRHTPAPHITTDCKCSWVWPCYQAGQACCWLRDRCCAAGSTDSGARPHHDDHHQYYYLLGSP